jgi:hypothetical protein
MAAQHLSTLLLRPAIGRRIVDDVTSLIRQPRPLRTLSTTANLFTKGAARNASSQQPKILLEDEGAFSFIRHNTRPLKPREVGVTEIRGPYYSAMGKRYLQDVLET